MRHGSARAKAMGPAYYDAIFRESEHFNCHYSESRYKDVWEELVRDLAPTDAVLEVGCGTGQLAAMLCARGVRTYRGFDFSPEAVARARRAAPAFRFAVADARHPSAYQGTHDVVIATEVLEHLDDDLAMFSHLAPGTAVRFTLPMRDDRSHVRFFPLATGVEQRYGGVLTGLSVRTVGQWHVGRGRVRRPAL